MDSKTVVSGVSGFVVGILFMLLLSYLGMGFMMGGRGNMMNGWGRWECQSNNLSQE